MWHGLWPTYRGMLWQFWGWATFLLLIQLSLKILLTIKIDKNDQEIMTRFTIGDPATTVRITDLDKLNLVLMVERFQARVDFHRTDFHYCPSCFKKWRSLQRWWKLTLKYSSHFVSSIRGTLCTMYPRGPDIEASLYDVAKNNERRRLRPTRVQLPTLNDESTKKVKFLSGKWGSSALDSTYIGIRAAQPSLDLKHNIWVLILNV